VTDRQTDRQTDPITVNRILSTSNLIGHTNVSQGLFCLITFLYEVLSYVRILLKALQPLL